VTIEFPSWPSLDEINNKSEWSRFKQSILDGIKEISLENDFHANSLIAIYNSLNSDTNERFRSDVVSIFGHIGKNASIRSIIMPSLMHALMDTNSPLNRYSALGAIREMYRFSQDPIPENMLDTVVLHLQDNFVIVHQAAVRALDSSTQSLNNIQKKEALVRLINLCGLYKTDIYFLKEIFSSLFHLCSGNRILASHAISTLKLCFPTNDRLVDYHLAKEAMWICSKTIPYFEAVSEMVLFNLETYERDRYNNHSYSDRHRFFDWLSKIPKTAIFEKRELVLSAGIKLARKDPWESLKFAAIFNELGDYESESSILKEGMNATSGELGTRKFSNILKNMSLYANYNHLLLTKGAETADELLPEIKREKNE
jgi:hypothetical protein